MRVFDLLKSRIDKMEEKRDIEGLILALKDDDKFTRQESTRALGNIGSKEAIEPLTHTLLDPDKEIREEAIAALGRITIIPFIEDLKSSNPLVKEEAVNKIKQLDNPGETKFIPENDPSQGNSKVSGGNSSENDYSTIEKLMGNKVEGEGSVEEDASLTYSEVPDFNERRNKLKETGYYHFIERFVDKSKYDYQEDTAETGKKQQPSDLQKLKNLLEYKGISLQDAEIVWLVQEEIKKQEYQDFEEKITENQPTTKQEYLENYIKNYTKDAEQNRGNLEELLQRQGMSIKNLDEEIGKIKERKEIEEFKDKLLQSSLDTTTGVKGSPSILLKFMKKDLVEKRDKLISTGNYQYIENFVQTSKYDYQIKDAQKLKDLINSKGISLQDAEIVWLVQEEIKKQEYQDFEERITENQPTTKQEYLENYIKNNPQDTPQNMANLDKLFQKQKIPTIELEKEVKKIRQIDEIREFERKLSAEEDSTYQSLPVIESKVSEDKALKNAQILSNLGILFYDLGKRDYALSYFDEAISTYQDYVGAWKNKGLIFYTTGRLQEALTCFYHVLTFDPGYCEVWLDSGLVLFEMGKRAEAKQCYDKAVQNRNLEEISSYTQGFLSGNPIYQKAFDKFLDTVSSHKISGEPSDSNSTISKIMQLLN